MRIFILALAALLLADGARADGDAVAHADTAVGFFDRTCLKHFRDHDGLKRKVGEGGEWFLPVMKGGLEQVFLGAAPGQAWLLRKDQGTFALALRDDGTCSVFARRADEIRTLEALERLFKGGFFTATEVDSDHQTVFTRRYYAIRAGAETLNLVVSTTREPKAQFQAAFSLSAPGQPPQPPVVAK
ncbi:MAG: hypothetical protein H7841_08100 [Magnetospirillum sp. WYHS-4]